MAKFWVTKYALTAGIIAIDSEQESPEFLNGASWVKDTRPGVSYGHFYVGKEAFRTEAEAVIDAKARRAKKVQSLQKQIRKLEGLRFGDD